MVTDAEMQNLRSLLAERRSTLLDRLAVDAAGDDRIIDPGFLRLLADTHTAIAAVDAALAEPTTGDAP